MPTPSCTTVNISRFALAVTMMPSGLIYPTLIRAFLPIIVIQSKRTLLSCSILVLKFSSSRSKNISRLQQGVMSWQVEPDLRPQPLREPSKRKRKHTGLGVSLMVPQSRIGVEKAKWKCRIAWRMSSSFRSAHSNQTLCSLLVLGTLLRKLRFHDHAPTRPVTGPLIKGLIRLLLRKFIQVLSM